MFSPVKNQSLKRWQESQTQAGMERETWENDNRLLKELPIFGWLRFHKTLLGALQPDRHLGEYEIHYLKRGRLNWWVEATAHEFRPGSVFIIRPGELHGGDEESLQPCEHLWFRIKLGPKTLPGLSADESAALSRGFEEISNTTFPVSTAIGDYLDKILVEHRMNEPHGAIIARGLLHACLATIIRDYATFATQTKNAPLVTWRIRRALEMLDEVADLQNLKIADLAEKVGLSESGFRERFKAEMGFSPHEYILDRRITEARQRLSETDLDVTRIALDLGFSSSQYFATVFRRRVGMSPSDYRRRHDEA